jgi:hypothetical protein
MREFSQRTIKAGWQAIGLEPFNPKPIINRIQGYSQTQELQIFDRASHHLTPTQLQTPHTIHTLRQQVNDIQLLHPDLSPSISRVFCGALAQAESLVLSKSLLDKFGEERQHREAASLKSKSYIRTPDILYVRDAIRELDKKKSAEVEKI